MNSDVGLTSPISRREMLSSALGVLLALAAISSSFLDRAYAVYGGAIISVLAIALVLLTRPASSSQDAIALKKFRVDIGLIVFLFIVTIGISILSISGIVHLSANNPLEHPAIGSTVLAILILIGEALRRTIGLVWSALWLIASSTILFPDAIRALLQLPQSGPANADSLYSGLPNLISAGTSATSMLIVFTILFLQIQNSPISEGLADGAARLFKRTRAGSANGTISLSFLFGMASGGSASLTAAVMPLTFPMTRARGFSREYSGALQSASGFGAQILPPILFAAAFIFADLTGISYLNIITAALVPAVAIYVSLYIFAALTCPEAAKTIVTELNPVALATKFRWGLFLVGFFGVITLGIYLARSPTLGGLFAIAFVWLVLRDKRSLKESLQELLTFAGQSAQNVCRFILYAVALGMLVQVGQIVFGLGMSDINMVKTTGASATGILIIVPLVTLIFATLVPALPLFLTVVLLYGSSFGSVGIPILNGYLYILFFSLFATVMPPASLSVWYAVSMTGAKFWPLQITVLRMLAPTLIIPVSFILNPELIMQAELGFEHTIWATIRLLLAIWFLNKLVSGLPTDTNGWINLTAYLIAAIGLISPEITHQMIGGLLTVYVFGFSQSKSGN